MLRVMPWCLALATWKPYDHARAEGNARVPGTPVPMMQKVLITMLRLMTWSLVEWNSFS